VERRDGLTPVRVDIRDGRSLAAAFAGADAVIHTASIIDLSSTCTREQRQRSWDINVGGTHNVIAGCREAGVGRLVYTSSSTVVFDGRPADVVTEDFAYAHRPDDLYRATKGEAERAVLAANGSALRTCAIRPTGIYGPGERYHLPRVVDEAVRGRLVVKFGSSKALSEWSYVDNVVHGHLLALDALTPGSAVGGQAYFINDGWYAESFELLDVLLTRLGLKTPKIRLPAGAGVAVAKVWEWAHCRLGAPKPLLTPIEMRQLAVSHPSSIDKARRDLGYEPVVSPVEAIERTLPYLRNLLASRPGGSCRPDPLAA
jgi:3beta-hydroxy-delta5-steroid dehydrogenase/steroid delta-isomerase